MIEGFSKYRIIKKLGAGGMGEVYKAEDLALLRSVAIKVMSKQGEQTEGGETRFLREARAASIFNHPNIATIYEIGETDDQAFIVMEYVEGRSLRDLIAGKVNGKAILGIALQICDALIEAHSHGVIHRDIKPENILLTDRLHVKLVDFGLAKTLAGTKPRSGAKTVVESVTESGTVMGTLSYMSPEQLRGELLDERTDIFSFGIVLYEMITGRLPFLGASAIEVASSILKDAPIRIDRISTELPHRIISVVMRAIEKDRGRRYSSFVEVRGDLEAFKQGSEYQADSEREPTVEFSTSEEDRRSGGSGAVRPSSISAASRPPYASPPVPTILVLPLETVGSAVDGSFIGVGLAHAIMTDLAKINGLSVLSKSAGAGVVDREGRGARELARELGATILLEGEVMRAGQTMGVLARLTDVETGRVIWGEQYRGDASDLFSMQDAVCESVASALKLNISSEVRDELARPATTNIDAFELYSRGRAFLERRDVRENIDKAIEMFEEASKLDPGFALAHAGLGEAYWLKYRATSDSAWVDYAIAASDHALVLDPHQAQIHISLGIVYFGTGRTDRAIEEFEHASKLQPLGDTAHRWLGRCYTQQGEMERAISCFERAIELRPGYWENYSQLGFCYYVFGRYRDASEQFRRVITFQPDNYLGYDNLGGIYILLGLYEDAVAMHKRAIEIHPNHRSYSNLGTASFYLRRYEEAIVAYEAAIDSKPRDDVYHRNLGDVYLRMGRERDAEKQFELAGDLLNEQLTINPDNATLLARLAIYQAKLHCQPEALATIERAISLEPHNTTLMYRRAVVCALTGDADKAIEHLGRALGHGYSRSEAERDPDLETLRDRAEYKSLFASRQDKQQ